MEPHAALDVPLDAYLRHGSNYETVRLIALSDRVLRQGRELRRPLRLRARGDPRAPGHVRPRRCRRVLGVPETGAAAGGRRPAGADRSGGAASDLRGRWSGVSEPAGARPRRGRSLWVRLVRLRLHRLVHARRPLARLDRRRAAAPLRRDRPPGAGMGCRAAGARRGRRRHRAPEPRDASFSRAPRSGSRSGWSASPSGGRGTGGSSSPSGSSRGSSS